MTTPITTWRIPPWAWIAISLAVTAEAAINALRAYGLGQHLEHFTVDIPGYGASAPVTVSLAGTVLVLAAIAISLAQARAAYVAFRPGALARQRALAAPIALLLLAVSVSALSLTLLEAQRSKTGDEGGQRTAYDIAKSDYDAAAEELKRLEGARTPAEVRASMDAAPVSRIVFRRTAECTDVTRDDSFAACKPILDLRQEMASAIRKLELNSAVPTLKAKLDALPRPAEPAAFELLMGSVWGWIMGLAVVAVATFGAPLFAIPTPNGSGQPNGSAQTSFGASDADSQEMVATIRPDNPNRPAGQSGFGKAPNRPRPSAPDNAPDGRTDDRKGQVLAFIQTEHALGRSIPRQADIAERFDVPRSTLSDWCREWEAEGSIPARRTVGRCKVIMPKAARRTVAAE